MEFDPYHYQVGPIIGDRTIHETYVRQIKWISFLKAK